MGAGSEDSAEDGSVDNKLEDDCGAEPSTDQSSLEEMSNLLVGRSVRLGPGVLSWKPTLLT